MFDWFSKMFSGGGGGAVNPESGVVEGQYSGIGSVQGPSEGTGEGTNWGSMTKKQYADLGRSFQAQQVASSIIQGGINAGFDNSWLAQYEHAGSAEGQKI